MSNRKSAWVSVDLDGLRLLAERTIKEKGFGIMGAEGNRDANDSGIPRREVTVVEAPGQVLAEITEGDDAKSAAERGRISKKANSSARVSQRVQATRAAAPRRRAPLPKPREQRPAGIMNYPGGKSPYVPAILAKAKSTIPNPDRLTYVEPFVGGGVVAAAMIQAHPEARFVLNDLDAEVMAVYRSLQEGQVRELVDMVERFDLTFDTFAEVRASVPEHELEIAFRRIVLAYSCWHASPRSGALGGGDRSCLDGLRQKWTPRRIVARLEWWADKLQTRDITLLNNSYGPVLREHADDPHALIYLDPPYLGSGSFYASGLYLHDYEQLASVLKGSRASWMLSHDNQEPVLRLFDGWATVEPLPLGKGARASSESVKLNVLISPRRCGDAGATVRRRPPLPNRAVPSSGREAS